MIRTNWRYSICLIGLLSLSLVLGGCRKSFEEKEARALMAELAAELMKSGSETTDRRAVVERICKIHSAETADLEFLFASQPEAKTWLVEALQAEANKQVLERKAQWEARLVESQKAIDKMRAELAQQQTTKLKRLKEQNESKLSEIEQDYQGRIRKLQDQIMQLKKEIDERKKAIAKLTPPPKPKPEPKKEK